MAVTIPVVLDTSTPGAKQSAASFKSIGSAILTTADRMRKMTQFTHDFTRILGSVARIASRVLAPAFEAGLARISEAWDPVMKAVGKAFEPVTEGVRNLITQNRELIAMKLVTFLKNAGGALIDVFGFALVTAAHAVGVLRQSWNTLVASIAKVGETIESIPVFGNPAMAAEWKRIGTGAAEGFYDAGQAAREQAAAVEELTQRAKRYLDVIEPTKTKVSELGDTDKAREEAALQGVANMLAAQDREIAALSRSADEALRIFNERIAKEREITQVHNAEVVRRIEVDRAERDAAIVAEREKANAAEAEAKKITNAVEGVVNALNASIQSVFVSLYDGTVTLGFAIKSVVAQTLQSVVHAIAIELQARAVAAAMKAFEGTLTWSAALGPIGLGIAAGVGAAAFAAAMAYTSQLPSAQHGLINPRGGTVGRDSVLALVEPGEAVVPYPQQARDRSSGAAAVHGRRDMQTAGGIHFTIINQVPTSEMEQARVLRRGFVPALARLGYRAG